MKNPHPLSAVLAGLFLSLTALTQAADLITPGAKLEKLATGFGFSEGATADSSGTVYFTDQPNNRILRWTLDGKLETFLQPAGRANGMYFAADGALIACCDEKNQLWSIRPDKSVDVLLTDYQGKRLNGPNDAWVAPNGAIYLTDPFYSRAWWDHQARPQAQEAVYRLSPDKKSLVRVAEGFVRPNGIVGTPDGKFLFVADIDGHKTFRFAIKEDGALTDRTPICPQGSDGMTIDELGNLYLTGQSVLVYDQTGKNVLTIPVPEIPANLCFGGKDHRTLFITARTSLYSLRMQVRGANPSK